MKNALGTAAVLTVFVSSVSATQQAWTGQISDAMCGTSHAQMTDNGKKMSDKDCTVECAKHGGYVFVSEGRVFKIENQGFKGLKEHAGETVTLTGEARGDGIKIAKLEVMKKMM